MATETWAFIDEYGNPNLATEVEGASKFFIVAAVVLDAPSLASVRLALDSVRIGRFQTGPMKSKKLGDDREDWARLLTSVAEVPFRFYALVVDKRQLDRAGGLQWKQSFYKHLCGRVYGKLMRAYPALHVRADRYGDEEFKESFGQYIQENHRPTLFDRGTFDFVPAKDDVLIQLADILCGLLARCYDPDHLVANPQELLRLVQGNLLLLDEWPPRFRLTTGVDELSAPSGRDDRIARYSLSQAERYLVDHEDDLDPDTSCRIAVVERLLYQRRFGEEHASVMADELLDNLRERGLDPKGHRWFRTSVIAGLRDRQVLITSSSSGYKLPVSVADLVSFARQAENLCVPILNRVEAACEAVKLVTQGEVDVLQRPELEVVRELLGALDERTTESPDDSGDV